MPRKHKGKYHRKTNKIDTINGNYLLTTSIGASQASALLINPSIFPRSTAISAVYQNYRYVHIAIHMLPMNVTSAGNFEWVLGYSSDVSSSIATITSQSAVSECTPSGIQYNSGTNNLNYGAGYPNSMVVLSRSTLCGDGSLKWWKCVGDSDTNAWENFQGQLLIYNAIASTQVYRMWVKYVIEFSSPITSLLTRVPFQLNEGSSSATQPQCLMKISHVGCNCSGCLGRNRQERKGS
jgi:hypothetical protein